MLSIRARDPVLITTDCHGQRSCPARIERDLNGLRVDEASVAQDELRPLSRYFLRCIATSPSTIVRLRSRTTAISTFQPLVAIPNSAPLRT